MSRQCEVCGKGVAKGNKIETRGKAKYLGGVGTKITGKTRREFRPNLQNVKIANTGGGNRHARVCTRCLRSGAVAKAIKQKPFQLPNK
jgi:large subunit ribosomal protein L28